MAGFASGGRAGKSLRRTRPVRRRTGSHEQRSSTGMGGHASGYCPGRLLPIDAYEVS
jgi:hypothetical protein